MTTSVVPEIKVEDGIATIDGLAFFAGGIAELKGTLHSLLSTGGVHLVVTTNTDQVLDFGKSDTLNDAYHKASLRLVDGKPLQSLVRVLGARDIDRITGADLLPLAADWSRSEQWRIAIVGGSDAVGEQAAKNLRDRYPGSQIEHISFPYLGTTGTGTVEDVANQLHEYQPDISFVCLGSPKQEEWVVENTTSLPHGIYVGAGAAVDFAAGAKRRAPLGVQKMGMEWTWRLFQEPSRLWRRYLVKGSAFLLVICKSIWGSRK